VTTDTQQIQDRLEIEEMTRRYSRYFDSGDLESYFGLFLEEAVIDIGAGETDKPGMMQQISDNAAALAGTNTRHFITNLVLDSLTETEASGCTYFLFTQTIEGVLQPGMTGVYNFQLRKTENGWKIIDWRAVSDAA